MENRDSVVSYINRTLDIAAFEDYCPNGLQVAGRQEIRHIVSGVLFVAAGHHATERYGVQALGAQISSNLQVTHQFIDVDNPA